MVSDPDNVVSPHAEAVDAISHQLRTHLALVAGSVELLTETDLSERSQRQAQTALTHTRRIATELHRLTTLLEWSAQPAHDEISITELLHRHAGVRVTDEGPVQLRFSASSDDVTPIWIHTDERRLSWALDVLVDDVAAQGGELHVVSAGRSLAHLAVIDPPPPPANAMRQPTSGFAREVLAELGIAVDDDHTTDPPTLRIRLPDEQQDGAEVLVQDDSAAAVAHDPVTPVQAPPDLDPPEAGGWPEAAGWIGERSPGAPDRFLILVVEDDADMRAFLERTLSTPYRVVAVGTGEDGLTAAHTLLPDLIVCDLVLPGADGETLVARLSTEEGLSDIPIIVLTGRTDEAQRVRLLRQGADDYLTKPFVVDELRARIANLLAQRLDLDDLRDHAQRAQRVVEQLQEALDSRVVIEQAKALVAAQRRISIDEAFAVLRRHANDNNLKLRDLAHRVVDRSLSKGQ